MMPDGTGRTQTCPDNQDLLALEQENRLLRQENDRLQRQAEGVAEANVHAAELTRANEQLAREIEDRTQMEQTLRDSECRLHTVLDGILAGVLIVDAETHQIVDVNPHAAEIIGRPRDQILGHVCHCFVCPAEKGSCPIRDLGQTIDRSECFLLRADGTKTPVLKTVVRSTWEGREYLIESFVDISRLKGAEHQIKESLSLLEATLNATADGILVVNLEGKIKSFNRQFQHIWNIPDVVLQNHSAEEEAAAVAVTQVKDPGALLAMRRHNGSHPEAESFDVLELQDGRILERTSRPQILGDRVVGHVVSFRDVTERYLADQKQAALLHRVAVINEELSHFAYIVSHDLKAPLRGIKLVAEWLGADYGDKLGDEGKEQMALLQSRVNRMHNLIDGVLQYSRVGRVTEDTVEVNLNELIPAILDMLAPPDHIQITVDRGLPTIPGEKTRLTQVFQNVLSNAVKFMDKPQGEIHVGCVAEGDFWKFSVADNGIGIEEKHFERIFRIFQTLAPKDEYESTGVGLTLVKKIVELYGGRIWIESEVGKGSTFFFTFPKVAGKEVEPPLQTCAAELQL